MIYYAHSGLSESRTDWQPLSIHLKATADIAAASAKPIGLERAAFAAGLFHDLGKYNPRFQHRIAGENLSVDHATAGGKVLLDVMTGNDKAMAEVIAYAILGHHTGLPDRKNGTNACLDWRIENCPEIVSDWREELGALPRDLAPLERISRFPRDGRKNAFAWSLMGRMIFSCLVDADFRDTEAFYAALESRQIDRQWPELQALLPTLSARYEEHMAGFSRSGDLNALRGDILEHVRGRAALNPGVFTLTVPTGGGKTLASLGFALDHAKAHGHRRIIYAIPFTSIIEQTAAIFREVLEPEGEQIILEHHSAINDDTASRKGKEPREQRDKLKLAMEDWGAPVVVTTNVQLFESLFAARTSKARKLHNIAGSIIILDEAQTLPRQYLLPVMRMLEALADQYGCTIVLCTATQPALGKREGFDGLSLDVSRELAPNPQGLAMRLARARIRHAGDMSNDALVAALGEGDQALVIVNSRRHALDLYRQAQTEGLSGLVHLTTRQCAAHRRAILEDVRERLKDGQPCRVIATSLVEAGVDIDFPSVYRAEAGLDQIVQAAGRCNREGKRRRAESIVTVFTPPDYAAPVEVKGLIGDMKRIIDKHDDLLSLAAIEDYFREVYWRVGEKGLDGKSVLDCFRLTRRGTDFGYRTAAEKFRLIECGMEPVIIAYDDCARRAIEQLKVETISSGRIARLLQSYVVQVPPRARALLLSNRHVRFVEPELRGDQFAVLENASLYSADIGLLWEDADYLSTENMIV